MKKYDIFSGVVDIVNQLLTRHLPFALLGQVDELTAKPSLLSIRGCLLEFSRIKASKTLKKFVSLTDSAVHTFLEGKENQNEKRKTENFVFSGFGNCISRGWERKSTTGRFSTGRLWLCTWKISLSVRTKSITENFVNWRLRPLLFCYDSTRFFILNLSANALIHNFFRGWRSFYFHLFIKSTFLVNEVLLCSYDKQNTTSREMFFVLLRAWDKEKILSSHEESNLRLLRISRSDALPLSRRDTITQW